MRAATSRCRAACTLALVAHQSLYGERIKALELYEFRCFSRLTVARSLRDGEPSYLLEDRLYRKACLGYTDTSICYRFRPKLVIG